MTHLYCGIVFKCEGVTEAICGHEHRTQEPVQERRASHRHHCVQTNKLMDNAIYGKFLQNVMKQSTLKFVNTLLDAIKVQSLPGYVRTVYNNGDFTIADVKHEEVKFDKPIYLGATITELAKLSTCTGSTTTMWCHTGEETECSC